MVFLLFYATLSYSVYAVRCLFMHSSMSFVDDPTGLVAWSHVYPFFLYALPHSLPLASIPKRDTSLPFLAATSCPTLASFKCSICVTSFCTSAHCLLHHIYFLNTPPYYPIRSYSYYSWCFAFLESASLSSKIYFIVVGLSPSFSKLYRAILGLCNNGGGRGLRTLN